MSSTSASEATAVDGDWLVRLSWKVAPGGAYGGQPLRPNYPKESAGVLLPGGR